MRVKAAARTLYDAKVLCDQFVRRKVIFLHVSFAVTVMLSPAYYAPVIAANAAADKVDALFAIEVLIAPSLSLSHKQILHF